MLAQCLAYIPPASFFPSIRLLYHPSSPWDASVDLSAQLGKRVHDFTINAGKEWCDAVLLFNWCIFPFLKYTIPLLLV